MRCWHLVLCLLAPGSLTAQESGFRSLFNGKDLAGWEVKDSKNPDPTEWSWKDGVLVAKPASSWLASKAEFGDFILKLEWKVPVEGNSGVFLRVPIDTKEQPWVSGMEIQILDDKGAKYQGKLKPYQWTGSIYGVVPAKPGAFQGADQWHRFEITCKGDQVAIVLNGMLVSEADMGKEPLLAKRGRRGQLGLQNHGTGVHFRNLEIRELK